MSEIENLKTQLEKLEHDEFMLNMCDHWQDSDYRYSWKLREEIKEVKGKIKELEENGKIE